MIVGNRSPKNKLHVIMPIGGIGERFHGYGYKTPKPLINVLGQPMFLRAASSLLPLKDQLTWSFVVRKEYQERWGIGDLIQSNFDVPSITVLERNTLGAVDTCMQAPIPAIGADLSQPMLVLDCDLWFSSCRFVDLIKKTLTGATEFDAGLLSFCSNSPRYSYARVAEGRVIETAEKRVISAHALAGAYFFRTSETFLFAAEKLLTAVETSGQRGNEVYLSEVFNVLVARGSNIALCEIDQYASFGTPDELRRALHDVSLHRAFHQGYS
jgi:NDP-sugar pyrophosphorylase family protein